MKILINALSGNGDALMFSPALKLIKSKDPSIQIDMLVMFNSVKEMYENHPDLNSIYFINFLKQSKLKSIREVLSLRKNKYDYTINIYPSNRSEYNIVNYLLGGKKRIAHHYNHTNKFRAEFLNNILINEVKDIHNVLQNIEIAKRLVQFDDSEIGNLEIHLSEKDITGSKEWYGKINPANKKIIGFHTGSALLKNHIHKRWSKNKFAELALQLIKDYNAIILLFGNEFELNEEINGMIDGQGIIASTDNYMDSIARLKYCNLFVSNDTAFLHSAAAFQIPTVGVFAYTNQKELFPWKTNHIIVRKNYDCSPCFYNSPKPAQCKWKGMEEFKCMKNISVQDVFLACQILLNC